MINFALFGAGRIGSIHAGNLVRNSQARLVALYDPKKANADRLAGALGCEQMGPDQIFTSDDIHAVLICSATSSATIGWR